MSRPAVFLDRDGTLVAGTGFLGDPAAVRLLPGAREALAGLRQAGFWLVVLSNQSGVARGFFTPAEVVAVQDRVQELLGGLVDRWFFCPHHPTEGAPPWRGECRCRKPAPGMLEQACRDLEVDLAGSFAIGDQARDLELFRPTPVRRILVLTGRGEEARQELAGQTPGPDLVARDLAEAAAWILARVPPGVRPR